MYILWKPSVNKSIIAIENTYEDILHVISSYSQCDVTLEEKSFDDYYECENADNLYFFFKEKTRFHLKKIYIVEIHSYREAGIGKDRFFYMNDNKEILKFEVKEYVEQESTLDNDEILIGLEKLFDAGEWEMPSGRGYVNDFIFYEFDK